MDARLLPILVAIAFMSGIFLAPFLDDQMCTKENNQEENKFPINETQVQKQNQSHEISETSKTSNIICSDGQYPAFVAKIVDGDTVDLQDGQIVRLLCINTPEKGQPCFQEASDRLAELVLNKKVCLEQDVTDKGIYGRLLRHLFVDGKNVGALMLKEGFANMYIVSPDVQCKEEFEQAEKEGKENNGCIWKSSDYTDCIGILYFEYNAPGDDRENLNGEYVKFRNSCDVAISMKGWTVKDEATHTYTFPNFVLGSNNDVTLYTGFGADNENNLYWSQSMSVWNNDGDTLYLRDSDGNLVIEHEYGKD